MKKALLIFLMLVLPLQAFAAMERSLAHMASGNGHGAQFVAKHMAKHAAHVLHHHDDEAADDHRNGNVNGNVNVDAKVSVDVDGDDSATHVDDSQKSVQHLADYDQAGGLNILLPFLNAAVLAAVPHFPPAFLRDSFHTRSVLPLLRPPRLPA